MLWVSQLGCLGVIAKVNYQYVDFAVDIAQPAITLALNIFATGTHICNSVLRNDD